MTLDTFEALGGGNTMGRGGGNAERKRTYWGPLFWEITISQQWAQRHGPLFGGFIYHLLMRLRDDLHF